MSSLILLVVLLVVIGGGWWGWPLVAALFGVKSVTDKPGALTKIAELMRTYDITPAEVAVVFRDPALMGGARPAQRRRDRQDAVYLSGRHLHSGRHRHLHRHVLGPYGRRDAHRGHARSRLHAADRADLGAARKKVSEADRAARAGDRDHADQRLVRVHSRGVSARRQLAPRGAQRVRLDGRASGRAVPQVCADRAGLHRAAVRLRLPAGRPRHARHSHRFQRPHPRCLAVSGRHRAGEVAPPAAWPSSPS